MVTVIQRPNKNATTATIRKRRQAIALFVVVVLFGATIIVHNGRNIGNNLTLSFETSILPKKNIQSRQDGSSYQDTFHCMVHVHGFHHSGTGFLRQIIYKGLGGSTMASVHNNTGYSEDEGQHFQSVYPTMFNRTRDPALCGIQDIQKDLPRQLGKLYYCPSLPLQNSILARQQQQKSNEKKERLFQEWSNHWNLSKLILIQKTPSFDVLYLEQMKLCPTVHLLVMRHPFVWNHDMMTLYAATKKPKTEQLMRPVIWLDVWATILQQLARGEIQSYAVVLYETVGDVSVELASHVQQECHVDAHSSAASSSSSLASSISDHEKNRLLNLPNQTTIAGSDTRAEQPNQYGRRRLHLWEGQATTEFQKPKPEIIALMKQCRLDIPCRHVMKDLEPILLKYFGYTWNVDQMFVPTTRNDENKARQKLLFTSQQPPPEDLVRDLQRLKDKYCF